MFLKTTDSIYQEHQLVTYHKDDIYVTLVCELSDPKLDLSGFYKSLETSLLNPIIEQIETVAMGGSMLQTSVNSIRSLYVLMILIKIFTLHVIRNKEISKVHYLIYHIFKYE